MDVLGVYLNASYRRDVMRETVEVTMPAPDPEVKASTEKELARINALRLGVNLAQRDFASYQHKRALERLLAFWKEEEANAGETGTSGSPPGDAQVQGGFASFGVQDGTNSPFPQAGDSNLPQGSGTEQAPKV